MNLDGVKQEFTDCEMFYKSPSKISGILKRGLAATTAGDNGAIDVYRDDNGCLRVSLHRRLCTISHDVFPSLRAAMPLIKSYIADIS